MPPNLRRQLKLAIVVWLLPRLIASAVVAQEPAPAGATNRVAGLGFTIDLGTDLIMRHRPPGPDFELYQVLRRSDTALVLFSIYAGNHPQIQDLNDATPVGAGLKGLTVQRKAPDGSLSRDVLLELPAADPPTRLHVWYRNLPAASAVRADQAIQTLAAVNR